MSRYNDFPLLWTPDENESFFLVKVPSGKTIQRRADYLLLMELRLEWMLEREQSDEIKTLLLQTLYRLNPTRDLPLFNQRQWREEWAMALVQETPEFYDREKIHYSLFPVEAIGVQHPDYFKLLVMHEEETLSLWQIGRAHV